MRQVIAVLENEDDAQVIAAASAVADLLGADVVTLRLAPGDRDDRRSRVQQVLCRSEVVAAALSAQGPDPLCWSILTEVTVPVIVVPSATTRSMRRISRVLLPLDGSPEAAAGVRDLAQLSISAGAEVVAVHVFGNDTVPPFWDQAAHTPGSWAKEFVERNLPPGIQLDLRRGHPAEEVLAEAADADADLVILSWSQHLGPGRARTVRHAITAGSVPVLLVAAQGGPSQDHSGPSALVASPDPT